MKDIIIDAIDLDKFVAYQNATLVTEFQGKDDEEILDTDISGYNDAEIFNIK